MILLLFVECSVFLVLLLCCYGFMALLFELLFFNIVPPPSDMAMAEALLGANDFWWGYAVPFSAGLGLVPWLDPIPIPGHQGTHWPCNVSQRSAPGLWNWHFNRPGRRAFSKEGLGTGTGFAAAACCNLLYVLASFVGQLQSGQIC